MRRVLVTSILAIAAMSGSVRADEPRVNASGADAQRYHLGQPATGADIAAAGISVRPDGLGLPPGQATARDGRPLYVSSCAGCHGLRGEGSDAFPALAGGQNTLKSAYPVLTIGSYWPYATTVWDYINRAMPYQNPGTLTPQQVYALTAYLLYLNKMVGERQVISQRTLPLIRLPNRNGFIADPRPDVHETEQSAKDENNH